MESSISSPYWVRTAAAVTVFAAALVSCKSADQSKGKSTPLSAIGKVCLSGVTIVDTRTGNLTANMSILMKEGKIVRIGATATLPADSTFQSINATGKFVVPGYNDMHTHTFGDDDPSGRLALMLAEGITGFRQMSGSPELLQQRRNGTLPLGTPSPALLIMPGEVLTPFNAGSVAAAIATIEQQQRDGADFIKVALVSPTVFYAVLTEARRVGLPIVGHLQEGVDVAQAAAMGFKSIEHLGPGDPIWIKCSTNEAALLAEAAAQPRMKAPPLKLPSFIEKMILKRVNRVLINPDAFEEPVSVARLQRALDTFSESKYRVLAAQFLANGTWQVPTLVRLRTEELADDPAYTTDPSLRYIPADHVRAWQEVTAKFNSLPLPMRQTFQLAYQRQLMLTKEFADAGVQMLAGTDSGGQVPGQSLHQEFDELARAGLTPLMILQMTTLNAAKFLGRTATMGSIQEGVNADLVLLEANPITSVENLHRIAGVVRAGRYYSIQDLNTFKARVEAGHGYLR